MGVLQNGIQVLLTLRFSLRFDDIQIGLRSATQESLAESKGLLTLLPKSIPIGSLQPTLHGNSDPVKGPMIPYKGSLSPYQGLVVPYTGSLVLGVPVVARDPYVANVLPVLAQSG